MITWTNETRKLHELIPWPRNPRKIDDDHAARLAESIEDFGQVETIAISQNNDIYNGHQRLNVLAGQYGMDHEVAVRVSSRLLSEKERERLTVYLHHSATGQWDWEKLVDEFELDDLLEWGFGEDALGIDVTPAAVGSNSDEPPISTTGKELAERYGVEPGQRWRLGEHVVICGDSLNRQLVIDSIDNIPSFIWADPPYGIDVVNGDGKVLSAYNGSDTEQNMYPEIVGDDSIDTAVCSFKLLSDISPTAINVWWGANHYANHLPASPCWLVWDKKMEMASLRMLNWHGAAYPNRLGFLSTNGRA